jgi:flagellar biogenesis protein FliO
MKKVVTIAGSLLLLSLAGSASAQSIEGVTMTSDSEDFVFTLRADKPLATPVVRTYSGSVRLRFPASNAPESIQVKGDGAAVKEVDVRSGSHDTAVMKVELGDDTKLTEADVRIENRKHIAVVRIARDLLPPMREARATPAEKPAAPVVAAAATAPAPVTQKAEIKPELKKPLLVDKPKKQLDSALQQSTASSPVPLLLAISAVLGLAYFVMRVLLKKNSAGLPKPAAIDIVAQKRIGPRHQLVIVRAFGREHLLSIQGGTTTPIATSDELDESFAQRAEPQLDLTVSQQRALPAAIAPKKEEETQFGSELLRVALAQRLKDQNAGRPKSDPAAAPSGEGSGRPAGVKDEKALSTAVAGLVRLRREAQL